MPAARLSKMLFVLIVMMILAPFGAYAGTLPPATLRIGGAKIEVNFEAGDLSLGRAAMLDWISESACAVSEYYDHFPVGLLRVDVVPIERGKGVVFGRTFVPGPFPVIRVMIARTASGSDLAQ